jgi:lysophospholipase L1-like esterase
MQTILCFGDSLTWGYNPRDASRYPFAQRWPGVLQAEAGGNVRVIEEALSGRTAVTESWVLPNRSGRAMLEPLLESHAPIDAFICMLGINDIGPTYKLTPAEIAFGCATLIWTVQKSHAGPGGGVPQILLVAPHPLGKVSGMMELFYRGGEDASRQLAAAYATIATACGCHFLDAGQFVRASDVDGVHLDPDAQQSLGIAIANVIVPLLAAR